LRDEGDSRGAAREFLALAGLSVAYADGQYEEVERRVLKKLIGKRGVLADATGLAELSPEARDDRLEQLARELRSRLSEVRRKKLVEDLVAVALADRRLAQAELDLVRKSARMLGVP